MNAVTIRATRLVVMLVAVIAPASLVAGGSSESSAPPVEPESVSRDIGAIEDEMKAALADIGIRTFEGEIAAVDFGIPSLEGSSISLSDYAGSFVFLNFWATWCPPCREEMPSMDVLHDQMQGRPFHILAVNVQENRETVDAFVSDYGYRFPVLLDQSGRVAANYSVRGIPTSYFISPGGRVLGILVGTRYWDEPDVLAAMEQIAGLAEAAQR